MQYEGPLARAQRTIELTAQDRTVAFVAGASQAIAPVNPQLAAEVWDVLDIDKMTRDRAEITGLASDSLHGEQEVEDTRGARKKANDERTVAVAQSIDPLIDFRPSERGGGTKRSPSPDKAASFLLAVYGLRWILAQAPESTHAR